MANGIEEDIREIRADVKKISIEGCAHRITHKADITNLWHAIEEEKTARTVGLEIEKDKREGWTMKMVMLVVGIVLSAMLTNVYATSAVVEKVVMKVMAAQAAAYPGRK
jgi:hypothetical protein